MSYAQLVRTSGVSAWANGRFDGLVHPHLSVFGFRDAYLTWQVLGAAAGLSVVVLVGHLRGLPMLIMGSVSSSTVLLIALLHRGGKWWFNRSSIIGWLRGSVYHYQVLSAVLAASLLPLMDAPVLPVLDVWVIGWIVAQAFGRVGCLMAGCCFGRPNSWGVRYGNEHVLAGHLHYLVQARLFPIQLLESCGLVFLGVLSGLLLLGVEGAPGTVFCTFWAGYAILRYFIEFFRADLGRIYLLGLSEAQWVASGASAAVIAFQVGGVVEVHAVSLLPASLLVATVVLTLTLGFVVQGHWAMLRPDELREVVSAIRWATSSASDVLGRQSNGGRASAECTTSQGISIRAVRGSGSCGVTRYELSLERGSMRKRTARRLGTMIGSLMESRIDGNMIPDSDGGFRIEVESRVENVT